MVLLRGRSSTFHTLVKSMIYLSSSIQQRSQFFIVSGGAAQNGNDEKTKQNEVEFFCFIVRPVVNREGDVIE